VAALALPADGKIIACDIDEDFTKKAKQYWKEAGIESKISLRIAPAGDTLNDLIKSGESGSYDFAFMDADKGGQDLYYELCLKLLRPGGIIAIDNTLWMEQVLKPAAGDYDTNLQRPSRNSMTSLPKIMLGLLYFNSMLAMDIQL
jgi:predicted O-methyltransferase YrrM